MALKVATHELDNDNESNCLFACLLLNPTEKWRTDFTDIGYYVEKDNRNLHNRIDMTTIGDKYSTTTTEIGMKNTKKTTDSSEITTKAFCSRVCLDIPTRLRASELEIK